MPECLIQPKGNIDNPLKHLRSLEMPGEAMQRDCFTTSDAMTRQAASQERGRKIKAEKDVDCERQNASTLLYTLAAAAASRSSTPNALIKQESHSSPASRCDSNEPQFDALNHGISTSPHSEKNSRKVDGGIIQATSSDSTRDLDAYNAFQQRIMGSKPDAKNVLPKQSNQLHLMESMMQRQRQLYEEYGHSNWMKMQRNDSNCLSKSKAKRYRWCVQKDQENDAVDDNHATPAALNPSSSEQALSPNSRKKIQPKRNPASNGPIHDKLYGTVFTGASKFRCRDCGKSFTTLLDLTVHMSKTGHYRDQNIAEMKGCSEGSNGKFAKPKKRSIMELDEKESAEKVLKCLGCGHSFDSLQDLTVHMIKTKHYEDVPSLRLYSQKNEFCGVPARNGMSPPSAEDRSTSIANQHLTSSSTSYPSHDSMAESFNLASGYPDPATLGFMGNPAFSNQLASQPNFANVLNMAALRLLGSFPPYSMQMPYPNAMAGYDMAYAAFAARMFLSSPWLGQLPTMNAGAMFPPFLNPTASMQPSMMSQSGQRSPLVTDINIPPHSTRSASTSRGVYLSSPEGVSTPKCSSARESDDTQINKSQVLRCVQCGESFTSLQKMTDHMRETTHFPIAMTPPNDDTRRGSRSSSSADVLMRRSPKEGISTASPLEQLAKLASGKSLTEMKDNSTARPKRDVGSTQKANHCSNSSSVSNPHTSLRSPTSVLSNERYIRPNSPQSRNESSLAGSDFIKSLESTIQSAISRVNQPCTSPSSEQSIDYARPMDTFRSSQKSKKQYILDSMLPNSHRIHRKSLPDERVSSRDVAAFNSSNGKLKDLPARSASDGEEYYRRDNNSESDCDVRENDNSSATSPPLDLSNQFQASRKTSKSTLMKQEHAARSNSPTNFMTKQSQPTDEAACQSNARKRWEKKQMKSISPSPAKRSRKESDDGNAIKQKSKFSCIPSVNQCYLKSGSNPIKEMQKIVNWTDAAFTENRPENHKRLTGVAGQKRKMELQSCHSSSKSYKSSSVLSDLVQHDDDEQLPAVNPLTQMEHLVNLKIGASTTSTPDKRSQGKKPNLAKPYLSSTSESNAATTNEKNPMSALLNLFQGAGNLRSFASTSNDFRNDSYRQKSNGRTQDEISKSAKEMDCFSNAARLNEKMAEIFTNLIRKEPSTQRNCFTKSVGLSQPTSSLSTIQQIQLQAFFTYHFYKKDGHIPDEDLESFSSECGLSVSRIKSWIQETKHTLSEKKRCDFIKLSGTERIPTFFCTSCTPKSAQGLSTGDFLHHLSNHISDIRMEYSDDGIVMNPNEPKESDGMEMKYKGEVHFKSLKSDDNAPAYSLTAHVTESRVPPTESPDLDVVAEHSRNRAVDVIDESPIKVSG